MDAVHPALLALRDALPGWPGHRRLGASRRRGWTEAGLGPSPPGPPRGSSGLGPPRRPGRGAEALFRAAGTKPSVYQPGPL